MEKQDIEKESSQVIAEPKFKWSVRLRHPDFSIVGNVAHRSAGTTHRSVVSIFANNRLPNNPLKHYKWSLNIKSLKWGFLAGICLESRGIDEAFKDYNWRCLGHGNYLVGSQGFRYSHSSPAVNNSSGKGRLNQGDHLQFDFLAGISLEVRKNGASFAMFEITQAPAGDYYRPCIYVLDIDDAVQMI